jgi:hypothetical protein
LLIHAKNIINPAKDCAIRNLDNILSQGMRLGWDHLHRDVSDCCVHCGRGHQKPRNSDK